ncbi:MAG TPA: DoxX-like family protein [Casimicrobiaceae bacterium]|nr:DoxX-like family protein [Casimicrobiaceae bacterium]
MDTWLSLAPPPLWLLRVAVAGVWIYEGLWCKVLGRSQHELSVVQAVPRYGERWGRPFLLALGWVELGLGLWVLSGRAAALGALAQTILLVALNANGLLWSRRLIDDPGGMLFKNFAFLVLAWTTAGLTT